MKILLKIEVSQKKILKKNQKIERNYKNVSNSEEVIIIGSGPAGLFAALTLLEEWEKNPFCLKEVKMLNRRRDIAAINKHHEVNPDSNYCFGEGAETYSDGKLYTRSKKGSIINILETLVFHGAKEEILLNHNHI